ncbi:hypothetical protein HS088_TW12G00752 [Tripterygium wilfordii]|uniref:H15 domain-containing protein n=1 Tax=Tripterygium wilfordii TaxID=458696 RepID=A0A7J7D0F9_TRIWF|nr:histone H1-like [Tripterygium wilfordii]KAF5739546.1 hypothetical protein HS088_TW12G00752 [Tripterygium wilfordii]
MVTKAKAQNEPMAKQSTGPKKPKAARSYPSFLEMITDAIVTLKERTGSSQYAITKFVEEKHKQLPANFRKLLLVHLKKLVASGKLVKVKNSFKLPSAHLVALAKPVKKPAATAKVKAVAAKPKVKVSTKPESKAAAKPKAVEAVKQKSAFGATKVTRTSPRKKVAPALKPMKASFKNVKKAKSVKSPAKVRAKKSSEGMSWGVAVL